MECSTPSVYIVVYSTKRIGELNCAFFIVIYTEDTSLSSDFYKQSVVDKQKLAVADLICLFFNI